MRAANGRAVPPAIPAGRTVIRIAIERMTVEGRSPADHARATAEMARALAGLVEARSGFDYSAASRIARLDGGSVPAQATPEEIGRHLAAQLFRRLTAHA